MPSVGRKQHRLKKSSPYKPMVSFHGISCKTLADKVKTNRVKENCDALLPLGPNNQNTDFSSYITNNMLIHATAHTHTHKSRQLQSKGGGGQG